MRVFISYGDANDQVTALRLQALGAVSGHTVFVPPAFTRQAAQPALDPGTAPKLKEADVVLGVVGRTLTDSCRQELNLGLALRKTMIVMASPQNAAQLQPYFGINLVVFDPDRPGETEAGIIRYLTTIDGQEVAKNVLLALGTLALGLLILAPAEQR